jgi:hypothetical protein
VARPPPPAVVLAARAVPMAIRWSPTLK